MSIVEVGKYTYNTQFINVRFPKGSTIKIGAFCSFSENITIYLDSNHYVHEWLTQWPFTVPGFGGSFNNVEGIQHYAPVAFITPDNNKNVVIGNDCWIGEGVTIMGGVTIGDGCIIAANSHVVKDTEPYTIVGGNPAKTIRHRHSPEVTEKLLEIAWWSWPDERINQNLPLICQPDAQKFIEEHV